jgi:hypothetical protein
MEKHSMMAKIWGESTKKLKSMAFLTKSKSAKNAKQLFGGAWNTTLKKGLHAFNF